MVRRRRRSADGIATSTSAAPTSNITTTSETIFISIASYPAPTPTVGNITITPSLNFTLATCEDVCAFQSRNCDHSTKKRSYYHENNNKQHRRSNGVRSSKRACDAVNTMTNQGCCKGDNSGSITISHIGPNSTVTNTTSSTVLFTSRTTNSTSPIDTSSSCCCCASTSSSRPLPIPTPSPRLIPIDSNDHNSIIALPILPVISILYPSPSIDDSGYAPDSTTADLYPLANIGAVVPSSSPLPSPPSFGDSPYSSSQRPTLTTSMYSPRISAAAEPTSIDAPLYTASAISGKSLLVKVLPSTLVPAGLLFLLLLLFYCRKRRSSAAKRSDPTMLKSFLLPSPPLVAAPFRTSQRPIPPSALPMRERSGSLELLEASVLANSDGIRTKWGRASVVQIIRGAVVRREGENSGSLTRATTSERGSSEGSEGMGSSHTGSGVGSDGSVRRGVGGYNSMGGYQRSMAAEVEGDISTSSSGSRRISEEQMMRSPSSASRREFSGLPLPPLPAATSSGSQSMRQIISHSSLDDAYPILKRSRSEETGGQNNILRSPDVPQGVDNDFNSLFYSPTATAISHPISPFSLGGAGFSTTLGMRERQRSESHSFDEFPGVLGSSQGERGGGSIYHNDRGSFSGEESVNFGSGASDEGGAGEGGVQVLDLEEDDLVREGRENPFDDPIFAHSVSEEETGGGGSGSGRGSRNRVLRTNLVEGDGAGSWW